jgi:hypothetical protein
MYQPDLMTVCLLGVGSSLLGLFGLAGGSFLGRRALSVLRVVGVLAGAGVGLAALAAQLPEQVWLPPLALAGVCALLGLVRQPLTARLVRSLLAAAQSRPVHATALLLLGPALIGWRLHEMDRAVEVLNEKDLAVSRGDGEVELEQVAVQVAVTDRGQTLRLWAASAQMADAESEAAEASYLQRSGMGQRLIRTGDAHLECNCHGWVFTGGRHWVRGEQVDLILRDNGYRQVTEPQPGDLVVYRDQAGAVLHTGLVRLADEHGLVLIESKWGRLGRFIHPVAQHCYPDAVPCYYHTPRGGHLLLGLPGNGRDADAPVQAAANRSL